MSIRAVGGFGGFLMIAVLGGIVLGLDPDETVFGSRTRGGQFGFLLMAAFCTGGIWMAFDDTVDDPMAETRSPLSLVAIAIAAAYMFLS